MVVALALVGRVILVVALALASRVVLVVALREGDVVFLRINNIRLLNHACCIPLAAWGLNAAGKN